MKSFIWCKLPILFSTLELNLGHNFSQFIHRFINWDFLIVGYRLYFQVFSNSQRDFRSFKCCSSWTSQFFLIHEQDGRHLFLYKPSFHFHFFPNSLRSREIGTFEVPLISYFVRLWGWSFMHRTFVEKRKEDPIFN